MSDPAIHVVKVGGSLLDLPDLPARLTAYIDTLEQCVAMIVGGGRAADLVRGFNKLHQLDETDGHWLAVRAMQLNAHMVMTQLPNAQLVRDTDDCRAAWAANKVALVDPMAWVDHVPHRWTFTSDSIAAHVATRLQATKLTLLKSTLPKGDCGIACATGLGMVDEDFDAASRDVAYIELVNLRARPPASCILKDGL
jgi:aspartokinase-like uncharacterized kinase